MERPGRHRTARRVRLAPPRRARDDAVRKAVFDSYTAVKWSRSGEKVILVRRETNPDDQPAQAVIVRCGSGAPTTNVEGPAAGSA